MQKLVLLDHARCRGSIGTSSVPPGPFSEPPGPLCERRRSKLHRAERGAFGRSEETRQ
jgi:hypothetical protein